MILRITPFIPLLSTVTQVIADVAPDVTTIAEGYNYIAKLPCIDCPYLYQDTSTGENGPWTDRADDNALLLNISLPFNAAYLSINNASLLSESTILPRIYASQVLSDYSSADLLTAITNNALNTAGPTLALSYGYSLCHVTNSSAVVFRFNVFEVYFSPPASVPINPSNSSSPVTIALNNHKQRVIELILLPRPLQSPGDMGPAWEIVTARLSDRDKIGSKRRLKTMMFLDWDEFGRLGSPSHLVSATSSSLITYVSSGFWGVSMFILGILGLFVVTVVGCVLGWDWWSGEYEKAQSGKGAGRREKSRGSGSWADVEEAKGKFLSASELGMKDGGSVVGVGKSD